METNVQIEINKNSEELNRKRQENNIEILNILKEEIEKYPFMRFIQILWMLNIADNTDRFHEEPDVTLRRIHTALDRMKQMQDNINNN